MAKLINLQDPKSVKALIQELEDETNQLALDLNHMKKATDFLDQTYDEDELLLDDVKTKLKEFYKKDESSYNEMIFTLNQYAGNEQRISRLDFKNYIKNKESEATFSPVFQLFKDEEQSLTAELHSDENVRLTIVKETEEEIQKAHFDKDGNATED